MYPFVLENLQEKIHSFGILRCGRQESSPSKRLLAKSFPVLIFLSPTQSHIMASGLFGFLPALHSSALPINTSHPCSDAPFSSPFPSSCVSDPFASWSLPRHNHGKQLYSEAKAKNAIAMFATIKTSAGGGLLKLQRALTAQPRGSGASPWLAPRHWGAARQGPRGTRAGDALMERAGAHSTPSSSPLHGQGKSQKEGTSGPRWQTRPSCPNVAACSAGSVHSGLQSSTSSQPPQHTMVYPALHKQVCNLGVRHVIYFAFPVLFSTLVDTVFAIS